MRVRAGHTWAIALILVAFLGVSVGSAILRAQPEHAAQPPATEHSAEAAGAAHGEEAAAEGNPVVGFVARLFNFAVLAGVLVYFLRTPLADYLSGRAKQIKADLVRAAEMRAKAAAELADIDRKLHGLPDELEALRTAGAAEVAAEEARIRQAADAERARLLDVTTREIAMQLKLAERDLLKRAAELAIGVASERVKATITDADQLRLVDRYLVQVGGAGQARA